MTKKIYIIAGESSGDFIGFKLIEKLQKKDPSLVIKGIGGPLMESVGIKSLLPIQQLAIMGFIEVLLKIFHIRKLIKKTLADITEFNPDILITIDFPGFNKIIAKKIKKQNKNIKLVHYVAPSVWAWKPKRAKKFAKIYDYLFCLLPFEPPYFEKEGLNSYFVGHPIVESGAEKGNRDNIIRKYNLNPNKKYLILMPGSRNMEFNNLMPIFNQVILNIKNTFSNISVIMPTVPHLEQKAKQYCSDHNLDFLITTSQEDKYDAFNLASLALIASGTTSLETSLAFVPTIVAYKNNFITDLIIKLFVKIDYASIINIIAKKEIIPEYVKENCNSELISMNAIFILEGEVLYNHTNKKLITNILEQLGYNKFLPSEKASNKILEILKNKETKEVKTCPN